MVITTEQKWTEFVFRRDGADLGPIMLQCETELPHCTNCIEPPAQEPLFRASNKG